MTPKQVDELPYRSVRDDGVREKFVGFNEDEPMVHHDSNGVAFLVHEWADGKKFKERF